MELALVVVVIVLVILVGSISSRVSALESEMSKMLLSNTNGLAKTVPTVPLISSQEPEKEIVSISVDNKEENEKHDDTPNFIERFVAWCMKDVIIKLGGLIVLLGVVFFLSLAFRYIGDEMKIAIGYMFELAIAAFGYWWMSRARETGAVLVAVGAGVGLFATFAGMYVYNIYSPLMGTILSAIISLSVGLIAVIKDLKELSVTAFVLALISPVVFGYFAFDVLGVFIYVLFISMAAAYIDYKKGWRELPVLAFLSAGMYSCIAVAKNVDLDAFMMTVSFVQVLLLISYSIFKISKSKLIDNFDSTILLISTVYVLFWIYFGAAENMQAFIMIIWATLFAGLAATVNMLSANKNATLLYAAVSVLYLFIASAKIFDGAVLSIVFIIEGLVVTMLAHFITRDLNRTLLASATTFVGLLLTFISFDGPMTSQDIFVVLLQSVSAITIGTVIYNYYDKLVKGSADVAMAYPMFAVVLLSMLTFNQISGVNPIVITLTALYVLTALYAEFMVKNVFMRLVAGAGFAMVYLYIFAELISDSMKSSPNFNLFGVTLLYLMVTSAVIYLLNSKKVEGLFLPIAALATLVAYLVWSVMHALFTDGLATLISLVIYSIVGYILLIVGNMRDENINIKHAGQAVLCLVAARVIFLDAWNYSKPIAVAICITVGLILIGTMFITNKKDKN